MQHWFCVGQIVRLKRRFPDQPSIAAYEVLRLLPADEDDMPLYRVRSLACGVEWIARQDRIESSEPL